MIRLQCENGQQALQQAGENEEGHGTISFILTRFQIMKKKKKLWYYENITNFLKLAIHTPSTNL